MRRKAGIGAIHGQKILDKYKEKGQEIQENQLEQMTQLMEKFKINLEEFASKYRVEIKKNTVFRKQFQEMCSAIGVDPLASSKGFWSELLGVGDFYYELGVQLVEISLATSKKNGGVIKLHEVLQSLNKRRKPENYLSEDDIIRAVQKLASLGSGMEIVGEGKSKFLYTIPGEFSADHTILLQEAENKGYLTVDMACESLNWNRERVLRTLEHFQVTGASWVDEKSSPTSYWFPSISQRLTT